MLTPGLCSLLVGGTAVTGAGMTVGLIPLGSQVPEVGDQTKKEKETPGVKFELPGNMEQQGLP